MPQHQMPVPSSKKDISKLHRTLRQAGWTTVRMGNDHFKLTAPNGKTVTHSSTPSDYRAGHKILADLRRTGAAPFDTTVMPDVELPMVDTVMKPSAVTIKDYITMNTVASRPALETRSTLNPLPSFGRVGVSINAGKLTLAFNGCHWWHGRAMIDLEVPTTEELERGATATLVVTFSDRDGMIPGSRGLIRNGKGFRIEFASSRISGGEHLVRQRSVRQADFSSTSTATRILLPREFLVDQNSLSGGETTAAAIDSGTASAAVDAEQTRPETSVTVEVEPALLEAEMPVEIVQDQKVAFTAAPTETVAVMEDASAPMPEAPVSPEAVSTTDAVALSEVSELLSVDLSALADLKKAIAAVNALKTRLGDKVSLEISKETGLLRGQVLIDAEL